MIRELSRGFPVLLVICFEAWYVEDTMNRLKGSEIAIYESVCQLSGRDIFTYGDGIELGRATRLDQAAQILARPEVVTNLRCLIGLKLPRNISQPIQL